MIRIIYYRAKCIGCNGCVEAAPERWRISRKDGKSTLIGGIQKKKTHQIVISEAEHEANLMAAANCPVKIIQVKQL